MSYKIAMGEKGSQGLSVARIPEVVPLATKPPTCPQPPLLWLSASAQALPSGLALPQQAPPASSYGQVGYAG